MNKTELNSNILLDDLKQYVIRDLTDEKCFLELKYTEGEKYVIGGIHIVFKDRFFQMVQFRTQCLEEQDVNSMIDRKLLDTLLNTKLKNTFLYLKRFDRKLNLKTFIESAKYVKKFNL